MSLLGSANPLRGHELIMSLVISQRSLGTLPYTILGGLNYLQKMHSQHLYVSGHLILILLN